MRFSALFGAATAFASFSAAAPTEGNGPSAVFHVKKFETAYNPDTKKTDIAFHISGTSRTNDARFADVACTTSSAQKTSGEIHPIQLSLCDGDDDVRFQLVPHGEGWAFKAIHLRLYGGPRHHPYDSATYVFSEDDVKTVHDGKKSYQIIDASEGFKMDARWNRG